MVVNIVFRLWSGSNARKNVWVDDEENPGEKRKGIEYHHIWEGVWLWPHI